MKSALALVPVVGGCLLGIVIGAPTALASTNNLPDWYHVSVLAGDCAPPQGQYVDTVDEHVILRCHVEWGKPVMINTPSGDFRYARHTASATVSVPTTGKVVDVNTYNGDDTARIAPLPDGTASVTPGKEHRFAFDGIGFSRDGTTLVAQSPIFSGGSDIVIDIQH